MALDAELVQKLRAWLRGRGKFVSDNQIGAALMIVDMDALRERSEERVTWTLWDKVSSINDASPEYVKSRSDYIEDSAVFLVSIDARVVIMQPHSPGEEGLLSMTEAQARALAEKERQALVEDNYFTSLAQAVERAI